MDEKTPFERLTEALENGQPGDPRDLAAVLRDHEDRAPAKTDAEAESEPAEEPFPATPAKTPAKK